MNCVGSVVIWRLQQSWVCEIQWTRIVLIWRVLWQVMFSQNVKMALLVGPGCSFHRNTEHGFLFIGFNATANTLSQQKLIPNPIALDAILFPLIRSISHVTTIFSYLADDLHIQSSGSIKLLSLSPLMGSWFWKPYPHSFPLAFIPNHPPLTCQFFWNTLSTILRSSNGMFLALLDPCYPISDRNLF